MSNITFTESGMIFRFPAKDCFHIEKSSTYLSISSYVKICECIVRKNNSIIFIEAKSSFARKQSKDDFKKNVKDICDKFYNSILLYAGLLIGRPYNDYSTIPENLQIPNIREKKIKIYLIISNFEIGWVKEIDEVINQELTSLKRVFCISDIKVINDSMASKHGLIEKAS